MKMVPLRIELLGGLRVHQGPRVITRFRSEKTAALLAFLAFHRHRAHGREVLIEQWWPSPEYSETRGRANLSVALSSLRHQLEPPGVPQGAVLLANYESVQLNPATATTDVTEFEAALQQALAAPSGTERAQRLVQAVDLYQGALLPGFYEEWLAPEQERLATLFFEAVDQLTAHLEQTGDLDQAIAYARRAVREDPEREEAHRTLMQLLAASKEHEAALRQYKELERLLDERLGDTPSAATRQLAQRIEQQKAAPPEAKRAPAFPSAQKPFPKETPPNGTVTFLLTDLESGTALHEQNGEDWEAARRSHDALLRREFDRHGGYEAHASGNGFVVAFATAGEALACAVAGQRALAVQTWPEASTAFKVRMALCTGQGELEKGGYQGPLLRRAARLLAAAQGGQILCAEATTVLLGLDLDAGVRLSNLGVYRLQGAPAPEPVFQVDYADSSQHTFAPLRADRLYTSNLPRPLTRFFGREDELARLEEALLDGQGRLVTLTGPGGTGKTRLALEVAERLRGPLRDAVWFVPLADLADASLTPGAVLEALHLPHSGDAAPLDQIVQVLSGQPSLLLLDNFEQLVEEGALFVRTLLERAPTLTCLVTSRQALVLGAEREFPVFPLATPHPEDTPETLSRQECVQLFVDRAQAVRPDFQVTSANAAVLAELCGRLEGIPLALELAAARAQVLTPAQMLLQMEHRFDFLVSRQRDIAPRHRSLHAAIDLSYQLLSPNLRRFFARLSVFRGGWTTEAAQAVCEAPFALDDLSQLCECSLVAAEEDGLEMRFRMLETLREFAGEHLDEAESAALSSRHAEFFLALAEEAEPKLSGAEQARWLGRLQTEHDNLRAALTWSKTNLGDADTGLRLAGALGQFWCQQGYIIEGRDWLAAMLSLAASGPAGARAKALNGAGHLACMQGDFAAARALHQEGLALARRRGDKKGAANALGNLGTVAIEQGDLAAARTLYQESLALMRVLDNKKGVATQLCGLGRIAEEQGDLAAARALHGESLALTRDLGDRQGTAVALGNLGNVVHREGDVAAAGGFYEEALAILRQLGDEQGVATALINLGNVAFDRGDVAQAHALQQDSLRRFRQQGDKCGIAYGLEGLAWPVAAQGRSERAARLLGAAQALREVLGALLAPDEQPQHQCHVAAMRAALGGAAFDRAWAAGRSMPLEQAIAEALADRPD